MNLEDLNSSLQVRKTKLYLSVESTWSGKGWIQGIWSVGGHEHFDIASGVESVELVDYFKHSSLNFAVAFALSGTSHSVDLIEEDYT